MSNIPILVTGGAGYIGSHCCKLLAKYGYLPVTFDNLSRGHQEFVKWGPLCVGDINDTNTLKQIINDYNPVAVIHFAAFAYIGESINSPLMYYENNVGGTISLLKAIYNTSVKHIVFSSSCAVYGIPANIPISETSPLNPISPYGVSKKICERIISDFSLNSDITYTLLRYFNAAGADASKAIGEWHDPEPHVIPNILMTAAGISREFEIFGNDYNTPDKTCIRDYVHVNDLAQAHLLALARLLAGKGSDIFNIGYGQGYSINELCTAANKITGREIKTIIKPRRKGDPAVLIANPSKALDLLSWKPEFNNLDIIIASAWEWARYTIHDTRACIV
jgi:UDP-glucose-4-epimerase GalE